MKKTSMLLLSAVALVIVAGTMVAPNSAFADDKACIQRQRARGASACIAKAKCNGVTSRKEQARLCGG